MAKYDSAGLAMIPSGYKASKVYSLIPNSSSGDFDFARSSSATRVNKDGLIETVATNVPRLDYPLIDGVVQDTPSLLLEPSRTNGFVYSDDFSNAAWQKQNVTLTSNYELSPSGDLTADRVVTTNTGVDLYQNITVVANTSYRLTFYAKLRDGENIQARFYDLSNSANISYVNYSSQLSSGEWKRIEVGVTTPVGCTSLRVWLVALTSTLIDVSFWGAQMEQGSYATSYIPTAGSTVTRAAETCNGAGTSADFNDSEGVLFAEISALADDGTSRRLSISNSTTTNNDRIVIGYSSANQIQFVIVDGGAVTANKLVTVNDISSNNKTALKYKLNDVSMWINGFEVDSDLVATMPSGLNQLNFDQANGTEDFYGNTKQLITFKQALTDAELEDLTSWDSFSEMAEAQQYQTV